MSNFKTILDFFGLSPEEAAGFLDVSEGDILRWCSTSDSPPLEVWQSLVKLFDAIRYAAEDAAKGADLDHLTATDLNSISLGLPTPLADGGSSDLLGPKRAVTAMAVASLARIFV